MKKETPSLLGCGIFNWHRWERQSDRYGAVHLKNSGTPDDPVSDDDFARFPDKLSDTRGFLYAIVIETRQSPHCGDSVRGFAPEQPEKGEKVILGCGTLFFSRIPPSWGFLLPRSGGVQTVGLKPDDGRKYDWLDVAGLYRLHDQTVELYFEPLADQGRWPVLRKCCRQIVDVIGFPIMIVHRKWIQFRYWLKYPS